MASPEQVAVSFNCSTCTVLVTVVCFFLCFRHFSPRLMSTGNQLYKNTHEDFPCFSTYKQII